MLFKGKNHFLSFSDALLCLIQEDIILCTPCILNIYQFFLTIILTLHIDSVR